MPTCTFDNLLLPVVTADYCAPEIHYAQLQKLYFTKPDAPLTLVTDLTEWNARLNNTNAATVVPAPIRTLHIIGSIPIPETTEKTLSLGRKAYTLPKNKITFRVDETHAQNISLARSIQTNGPAIYAVWVESPDHIFGGNAGIPATMKLFYEVPEGEEDLMVLQGELSWNGVQPQVDPTPFA